MAAGNASETAVYNLKELSPVLHGQFFLDVEFSMPLEPVNY